jgi:carbon monoxide dehydrogenase subunit G
VPEVTHTAQVSAPLATVWAFTRDLDNWAELVTGYQSHTSSDETDSSWVLKGDLGGLTRTVELQVHITQWRDEDCVEFTLQGVNEPVQGAGAFRLRQASSVDNAEPKRTPGILARLKDSLAR